MTEMSQQDIFRQAAEGLNAKNVKELTASVYESVTDSLIRLYCASHDDLEIGVIARKDSHELMLNMKEGKSPMQARGREWFELSFHDGVATIDLSVVDEKDGRVTGGSQISVDFSYLDPHRATVAILAKMKKASETFEAKLNEKVWKDEPRPAAA